MTRPTDTQDRASGYPEKQPRDKDEARKPGPKQTPDPDEGGLDRDSEQDGTNGGD